MKSLIQYIPSNLDLDALLNQHPPDFKYEKDNFVYILNLITEVPSKNKDHIDKFGYVPLNAELLQQKIRDYKKYLIYLIKQGVLQSNNRYVPGVKSRGYRFSSRYQTMIAPVPISKSTLIKRIRARGKFDYNMKRRYDYLFKWFDTGLQIDCEKAARFLERRYVQDRLNLVDNPESKMNYRLMNLLKLNDEDWRFHVDDTAGRLHTNLTVLKRELRSYLTYEGNTLTSLDIKCSQPTLSLLVLDPRFYEKSKSDFATIHKVFPSLAKNLNIDKLRLLVNKRQNEFEAYREAVYGDLYEYLKMNLSDLPKGILDDRDKLKELTFSVLYSDNRYMPETKKQFKVLFPELYSVFSAYKKVDSTALAVLLQKIEAELILNRASKIFAKQNPACPLFTIHDSIAVLPAYVDSCSEILFDQAEQYCGLKVKLKPEEWIPNKKNGTL